MKKIFLSAIFAMVALSAGAWCKTGNAGVVVLATKHLTPKALSVVEQYLGTTYEDDCDYLYLLQRKKKADFTKEIHYLHLDKDFQPLNVEGDDALKALEKALEVVRTRDAHSAAEVKKALRTVINLMLDIHNYSNIRIENIPHSHSNFTFKRQVSEYKPTTYKNYKWSNYWTGLSNSLAVFHADLWAEDMELHHGAKFAEMSKGTLREWVSDNGAKAAKHLAYVYPDSVITLRDYLMMDFENYDMMTYAGFRLAALLNQTIQ